MRFIYSERVRNMAKEIFPWMSDDIDSKDVLKPNTPKEIRDLYDEYKKLAESERMNNAEPDEVF